MKIVTTPTIQGSNITKVIGIASGSTVRAKNIGRDILAVFRNIIGGEITEYTGLMGQSREQAKSRMIKNAEDMGANAIVNVRFMTSMVTSSAAEILAYGTAVVIKED